MKGCADDWCLLNASVVDKIFASLFFNLIPTAIGKVIYHFNARKGAFQGYVIMMQRISHVLFSPNELNRVNKQKQYS